MRDLRKTITTKDCPAVLHWFTHSICYLGTNYLKIAIKRYFLSNGERNLSAAYLKELFMVDVPVGSIIAFLGKATSLSKEWKVCDGTAVNDAHSPLNGHKLPNLTDGRFLMGVSEANVGTSGGDTKTGGANAGAGWGQLAGGDGAVNLPDVGHTHIVPLPPHCGVLFICRIR
jgi:hypothetical protein